MGIKKLGFEELDVFYKDYVTYKEEISAELIPVSNLVEQLRYVKSAEEIAILQVAADIADATFTHILKFIRAGVTELEVANEMEMFMRKAGAKCSSFDMIIASGWRSALPHGVATSKVIEAGEMVTLDFGAVYNNYISDMTRTVAVGEPNEKLREIYEVVLEAQLAVCEKLKPGISCASADSIARDIITKRGYGKYFGHSLGHGIGLEVHEGPYLSANSSDVLVSGMAVTNEPGIYLPKIGGVRIEDDLIITEDGNYALTISPKELIVL